MKFDYKVIEKEIYAYIDMLKVCFYRVTQRIIEYMENYEQVGKFDRMENLDDMLVNPMMQWV